MQNFYIPDEFWHRLARDLVTAAEHPHDPETAVQIVLASAGVMPESSRADCEGTQEAA